MSKTVNQPTYKRQRFLLLFVRQFNGGVTAADLQKLMFLHTMAGYSDYYEFVPYQFGPYSFRLNEDVAILERDGFVAMDSVRHGPRIRAVEMFRTEVPLQIAPERGNALTRRAYREHPYYAINSEITGELFEGDELEQFKRRQEVYAQNDPVLYTVGYEGKGIEAFINSLIQNNVRLLCDVRKNPLSRKFGFSKGILGHIAQGVGIRYVHIPHLGIDSAKRRSLDQPQDYQRLFADYKETLATRRNHLNTVYTLFLSDARVALMCFERDPQWCHRHVIRDYFVETRQIRSVDMS